MAFPSRMTRCPNAFNAELGREVAAHFGDHPPEMRALIAGATGSSPYLKALVEKHADWLNAALDRDPKAVLHTVTAALPEVAPSELPVALRDAKAKVALITSLSDLAGVWSLSEVTQGLSDFADLAVELAVSAAIQAERSRGKLPKIDAPSGAVVALAMGKMGAGELNFSSDIDLIMVVNEEAYGAAFQEARSALVRATRNMTSILSDITSEGYVFRTDLRLRPDAAVTPVCLSMAAAESYYESVGRTWERAAYIKARAAAGDIQSGRSFLARLAPFIWRKHLDFAAIQDAHDMRLRIRAHKGLHGPITLARHNMKLGRGGIREIEFFTQTRQLIAGGRDTSLRVRGTVAGLMRLAQKDWIAKETAQTLAETYVFHREVEHRLQMIADAQTHDLPRDQAGFDRLAALMGRETDGLQAELSQRLEAVHALTEEFFAPTQASAPRPKDLQDAPAELEQWYSYPALRSARAVEIFERLKPDLLAQLNRAASPKDALEQFEMFLSRLPAGVQVFSLFEANPQLIDLIADIVATAPALSQYLGRNAQVFDAVIGGSFFDPWPGCEALARALSKILSDEKDYERQLDAARRWHKEWHFRIGVHFLRGLIDAGLAGQHYAELAEAVLRAIWDPVTAEFARKHGPQPGRGAVVLGMGSLGASALTATSDLDLIVIYDAAGEDMSNGARPLPSRQYFARLTQAFVTALSAQTAEGALYEVDMRLRPSGRQGPVATSLEAFRDYQANEAWTWEHLALTRARTVAGSTGLGKEVDLFREKLFQTRRDPGAICADVSEMRARLLAHRETSIWDGKRGPGRLQDIELLAQAAALIGGATVQDAKAQLDVAQEIGWVSQGDVTELTSRLSWFWSLQSALRLLGGRRFDFDTLGAGGLDFVLRKTGAATVQELRDWVVQAADQSRDQISRALAAPPAAR